MAATRMMPPHVGKGCSESQGIFAIIDYVSNPQKNRLRAAAREGRLLNMETGHDAEKEKDHGQR